MPWDGTLLNLKGYRIEKMEGVHKVIYETHYHGPVSCVHCGGKNLRSKGWFVRYVRHESIGHRRVWMHLHGRKFHCRDCDRYFRQRFPGILKGRHATEAFRKEIVTDHMDGICQSRLAKRAGIGSATVERWYHEHLGRKVAETKNTPCPQELGIDEHFFSRRDGYATTFCDLKHRKVYDVVLGRSEAALEGYLNALKGKEKVRLVCIDLSSSYRAIVRKHFPKAKIVADRFHVIRLIGHHTDRLWRELDPVGSKNRGLTSLIRRRRDRLRDDQVERLSRYLHQHPDVQAVYKFKNELCDLLRKKTLTAREIRQQAPQLIDRIDQLKASQFEAMATLGRTLDDWQEEIACMWRFTKNNAITEGKHNKMEMIARRAYGFRNFENYRLRVKALC